MDLQGIIVCSVFGGIGAIFVLGYIIGLIREIIQEKKTDKEHKKNREEYEKEKEEEGKKPIDPVILKAFGFFDNADLSDFEQMPCDGTVKEKVKLVVASCEITIYKTSYCDDSYCSHQSNIKINTLEGVLLSSKCLEDGYGYNYGNEKLINDKISDTIKRVKQYQKKLEDDKKSLETENFIKN